MVTPEAADPRDVLAGLASGKLSISDLQQRYGSSMNLADALQRRADGEPLVPKSEMRNLELAAYSAEGSTGARIAVPRHDGAELWVTPAQRDLMLALQRAEAEERALDAVLLDAKGLLAGPLPDTYEAAASVTNVRPSRNVRPRLLTAIASAFLVGLSSFGIGFVAGSAQDPNETVAEPQVDQPQLVVREPPAPVDFVVGDGRELTAG